MSDRTYDAFGHRFFITVVPGVGVAIDGTASALAAEAATEVSLPFACKLVALSKHTITGASEAVALVSAVACKSVAGTGTLSSAGAIVFTGTNATGKCTTTAFPAGSQTEFAAGDTISISEAVGTVASIQTHAFSFGLEELPN